LMISQSNYFTIVENLEKMTRSKVKKYE